MIAATQRRRLSFYLTLPLVVAIVPLLVAKLVALQRADIIAELADRVAHRDSREAVAALRQLASMPRPPAAVLVAAATSTDAEVADEARRCIGRLLRRAERHIEAERRVGAVARQLVELAESLAAQQGAFSPAEHPWLSSTTGDLLRLANQIPRRHTPLVAVHCDAILAAIASNEEVPSGEIVDADPVVDEPFVSEGAMVDDDGQSQHANLDHDRSGASESVVSEVVRGSESVVGDASIAHPAVELLNSPWQASWSHPLMRMVPAKPMNLPPAEESGLDQLPSTPVPESVPADIRAGEPPLADVGARELLRRWLDAEGSDIFPLEQELTRRGFGRLSERLVQQLFSPAPEDRFRLVDNVLTAPGVDARPWLVLLSADADADVRLLAVTIMATSNDAALVDQAWEVSIRDGDPRIAGLAERLRARREGVRRR